MQICPGVRGARHEAVVHEGIDCPVCEALEQLANANEKLQKLDRTIESLRAVENVNER